MAGGNSEMLLSCNHCSPTVSPRAEQLYDMYSSAINLGLLPLIATFGIFANSISMFVFTRRPMRTKSLNSYLAALAVSDIMVIITGWFMFMFERLRFVTPQAMVIYLSGIQYVFPLGMIAQSSSVFLTVSAGLDGFIDTCCLKIRKRYCRRRVAIWIIIFAASSAVIYNITRFLEVMVVDCWDEVTQVSHLEVCPTELRMNPVYVEVYHIYLNTILLVVGPIFILSIFNCCIICCSYRRRKAASVDRTRRRPSLLEEPDNPVALVMVVLLFIICNSLTLIINFLEQHVDLGSVLSYLVDISNLLVIVNSSVNFVIYFKFDLKFSKILRRKVFKADKKTSIAGESLIFNGAPGQPWRKISNIDSSEADNHDHVIGQSRSLVKKTLSFDEDVQVINADSNGEVLKMVETRI